MISLDRNNPLDILLENLFDYAGMFPPAALPFEDALRESARLPAVLMRPWLLSSDIVLDVAHARKLLSLDLAEFGFSRPLSLCLLATAGADETSQLADGLVARGVRLSSIEATSSPGSCNSTASSLAPIAAKHSALLAIEPLLSQQEWRTSLGEAVSACRNSPNVALKCRCTGPSGIGAERLSSALCAAADVNIPFKVTGGFHHPIVEPGRHAYPMGFLNLTVAVMLRRALGPAAPEGALASLLANSSVATFSLERGVSALSFSLPLEGLREARSRAHFSIGSCSLSEPDADLARLFPS
jgi:hypothetical protein